MSDLVGNPEDRFSRVEAQLRNIHLIFCCITERAFLWKCYLDGMSRLVGKPTMWFPNRSDTNQAVQSQKQAGSLKFRI